MSDIQYIASYTFPIADCGLASLAVRVDDLADRLGFDVLEWPEDGLGPSRGFGVRLSSGRVFVLTEHVLSIRHHYTKGPDVLVDATELATLGVESLLTEFLEALGLTRADVTQVAHRSGVEEAAALVARCEAHRAEGGRQRQ